MALRSAGAVVGAFQTAGRSRASARVGYNQNTRRTRSTTGDTLSAGFDLLHVGAVLTEYARSGMGWYAQAGMMFTEHFEAVARYGETRPRDGADPSPLRATELGGGLNYYLSRHDLKLQADVFWLYGDAISAGRWQSRLQAQLYF